jgi:ABC-type Na+ efflux pump permease subunit
VTIIMADANAAASPRTVAWLGYGGLIPFLVLALGSLLDHHHGAAWRQALYAYGAIILSFVGALHWSLAMSLPELTERQRSARYAWSVAPALIAWPAMLMSPPLAAPPAGARPGNPPWPVTLPDPAANRLSTDGIAVTLTWPRRGWESPSPSQPVPIPTLLL